MKRKILLVPFFILPSLLFSQRQLNLKTENREVLDAARPSCRREIIDIGCNYLSNPSFQTGNSNTIVDAFTTNMVQDWYASSGTADINRWIGNGPLPSIYPSVNVANMGAQEGPVGTGSGVYIEGIYTKTIAPFARGNEYLLSFFRSVTSVASYPFKKIKFKIVLAKCTDFPQYDYGGIVYPQRYQEIYCENVAAPTSFEQIVLKFIPNDSYDIVWIFPECVTESPVQKVTVLNFANPEIIDLSLFSAGSSPTNYPADCQVTIGPNPPNCPIKDAFFRWVDPNGNFLLPTTGQNLTVDATINYGQYKLQMVFPNAVTPKNSCDGTYDFNIEAVVDVNSCISGCTPPTITPNGSFDFCYIYDGIYPLTLTSTPASNYQWYKDGTIIPNETSQTYTQTISGFNTTNPYTHTYTVSANGCLSAPVNIIFKSIYGFSQWNSSITSGFPYCVQLDFDPFYNTVSYPDPNVSYTINAPSPVSISNFQSNQSSATICIPTNLTLPVSFPLTVSKTEYGCISYNTIYYHVTSPTNGYLSFSRGMPSLSHLNVEPMQNKLKIYPNPAASFVNIFTQNETIRIIHVYSTNGKLIKSINIGLSKNTYELSVQDLPNGIYYIKIITAKNSYTEKLSVLK